jgi:uridine kinase
MDQPELLDHISSRAGELGHPIVVGISGYGGSGKTTLARELVAELPGAVRMRGDDFLDPARSHVRSTNWDGVDRRRLVSTVLAPFRAERPSEFRRYDWSARSLGMAEPLPQATVLVLDLIGLFHPEALPAIDLAVWCDVDLGAATQRGIARDKDLGRDHESLWREVWVPNEIDFAARFAPQVAANVLYCSSR